MPSCSRCCTCPARCRPPSRTAVHTSFVQRLPGRRAATATTCRSSPPPIEPFDLDALRPGRRSSHCAAKSVVAPGRARHLCYCHYADALRLGPVRRLLRAGTARPWPARLTRPVLAPAGALGPPPRRAAPTAMSRILNMLRAGSGATIIARPSSCSRLSTPSSSHRTAGGPSAYALVVSALVPYKRLDIAIDAAAAPDCPLKIVGEGPDRAAPRSPGRRAKCEFLGRATDEDVRDAVSRARPPCCCRAKRTSASSRVEAQACGRPVVALARGGALETVVDGETGVLVDEPPRPPTPSPRRSPRRRPRVRPGRHPRPRRTVFPRPLRDAMAPRLTHSSRPRRGGCAMVKRYNRLLVAVLRPHRLAARRCRVPARLRAPLRRAGSSRVTKGFPPFTQYLNRPAVHRRAGAARLPGAGHLPAAARPDAGRRFLRGLRRQHPGRRPRHRHHPLRPGLLRPRRRRRTAAPSRCRSWCGGCSSSSTSRSPTRRASWSARCSSAAGAQGIGLKRILSPAPASWAAWWSTRCSSTTSSATR